MKPFDGFSELADFIHVVKPSGSFSSLVNPKYVEPATHRVIWIKGGQVHNLNGQFMTWAKTGGTVHFAG